MVYQILVNGEKPSDMQYQYRFRTSFVKLYNKSYADSLGLTFGKSFHDYSAFYRQYNLSDILAAIKNIVCRLCLGYGHNLIDCRFNLSCFNLRPNIAHKACQNLCLCFGCS